MILQGVKLTIQPLGVGYANRLKKAQNGRYVVFSPIYACDAMRRPHMQFFTLGSSKIELPNTFF